MNADVTVPGPLAGIVVVTIEHAVAAPMATRQLADLGARVIKIERIDGGDFARGYDTAVGGELSSVFLWTGRGKESLAVDLKTAEGRDIVLDLIDTADVFIQNLGPGSAERLGFGATDLRRRNPGLIAVSASGYGGSGPYSTKHAYDAQVQAEAGVVALTGTPEQRIKPGFAAADAATAMYLTSAVMMALFQRERTSQGTVVEVAMIDAMTDFIASHIYFAQHHDEPAPRIGFGHPSVVPYGEYPTRDAAVVIGIQNDREWQRLAIDVLHRADLASDPRFATNPARAARREEIDLLVSQACQRYTSAELAIELDGIGIACSRVNEIDAVAAHPQLVDRDRWVQTATPVGPVGTLRPVIQERGKQYPVRPVPALGQHTRNLLIEVGRSSDCVESLVSRGIVGVDDSSEVRRPAVAGQ